MNNDKAREIMNNVSNRDLLKYNKSIGFTGDSMNDGIATLIIVAAELDKVKSGRADAERFLDMSTMALNEYLEKALPDEPEVDDEPAN